MLKAKVTNDIKKEMDAYSRVASIVAKRSYEYFKSITPIQSGNARRNTRLKDTTIEANYDYAEKLDTGYSSQAPMGMSEANMDKYLDEEIKKIR
jgi:hypothetical protein